MAIAECQCGESHFFAAEGPRVRSSWNYDKRSGRRTGWICDKCAEGYTIQNRAGQEYFEVDRAPFTRTSPSGWMANEYWSSRFLEDDRHIGG